MTSEERGDRWTELFLTVCLLMATGGVAYLIMTAIVQWLEQHR